MKLPLKKMHAGVYAILTANDQILLVNKTRGPYTGKLDLPGGSIQHGEDVKEALLRELSEEVGLNISKAKLTLWDNASFLVDFLKVDEPISFFHIALIYRVNDFELKDIKLGISAEDVNGAAWVSLTIPLDQLSLPARYVVSALYKSTKNKGI
jgi:8-oxo-dGTP diphosphatase